ncbi:MAG: chemotaxis protein CheA [Planctomycetota bacterium]
MTDFGEIIDEFLVESFEGLDRVEGELVELEARPDDAEILSSIFRTVHSIKGASGFLEFGRLETLAHAGESLLDAVRSAQAAMDQEIASALLELGDGLRGILKCIEQDGNDTSATDPGIDALAERLRGLALGGTAAPKAEPASEETPAAPAKKKPTRKKAASRKRASTKRKASAKSAAEPAAETTPAPDAAETAPEPTPDAAPKAEDPKPAATARPAQRSGGSSAADGNIRVRIDQLDALMNLAGELVLSRNQIIQFAQQDGDPTITASAQRLSHVTTELQERIMQVRMQPIGLLFNKFPRVVRDLARQLDKQVELVVKGAETELDKSLLEAVKDPLTHLVRNSLDHGIECGPDRTAIGKPETATLELSAFHESGQVVITIRDDGRGIDAKRIANKAIEKGLVTAHEASQMDEREVLDLLFQPGFSTAEKITNVSGRGVGMDVVRSNLQAAGGTVAIETEVGAGTTVVVRLPLTLVIIPALTIRAGEKRFAIPQANLAELVLVEEGRNERIEWIHGKPVYRLRGSLLPIVDLGEALGTGDPVPAAGTRAIVVVQAASRRLGLLVDEILETVVKPLDARVKGVGAYAGTTILSDGRVSLILDVAGLADRAELSGETVTPKEEEGTGTVALSELDELALVEVGGGRRMAFQLAQVARFEEIDESTLEDIGGHRVLQYRGSLLPVVDLAGVFPGPNGASSATETEDGKLRAVVHASPAGECVFLIDDLVDIAPPDPDVLRRPSSAEGIKEVVVAAGRATEVIDAEAALSQNALSAVPVGGSTSEHASADVDATDGDGAATETQVCTFRLGFALFGFDVLDVQEVLPPQEATPVPLAGSDVKGLLNLRGETVVLLDLAQRIGLRKPGESAFLGNCMHVILNTEHGVVGVIVDEIGEVIDVAKDQVEPCPSSFDDTRRRFTKGVVKVERDLLLQLDAAAITEVAALQETPQAR